MRGLYAAAYLSRLARHYADTRELDSLDIGDAFDLITGTSTGGILACALANNLQPKRLVDFYRTWGPQVFPKRVPTNWRNLHRLCGHRKRLRSGAAALKNALTELFSDVTILDIWQHRKIALAIPAVNMSHHQACVFKTPHLHNTKHRDDNCTLVDVCLATTAAPIFRSMASLRIEESNHATIFVDGGLWANTPVLVGLIDALDMTTGHDSIEIFCLGTSPPPAGSEIHERDCHRTALGWKFGAEVLRVTLDCQQSVSATMAQKLSAHVSQTCRIIHFPRVSVPAQTAAHFDLDATDSDAVDAMMAQAVQDVNETLRVTGQQSNRSGQQIDALFRKMRPHRP